MSLTPAWWRTARQKIEARVRATLKAERDAARAAEAEALKTDQKAEIVAELQSHEHIYERIARDGIYWPGE